MDALLSQFSILANQALNDKNFDPSRLEQLLQLFDHEAYAFSKTAEAERRKAVDEAEASMKEAESYLNSLMDDAMDDFHRTYAKIERSSKKEINKSDALESAAEKYMDGALGSAMATKINKVHPS